MKLCVSFLEFFNKYFSYPRLSQLKLRHSTISSWNACPYQGNFGVWGMFCFGYTRRQKFRRQKFRHQKFRRRKFCRISKYRNFVVGNSVVGNFVIGNFVVRNFVVRHFVVSIRFNSGPKKISFQLFNNVIINKNLRTSSILTTKLSKKIDCIQSIHQKDAY